MGGLLTFREQRGVAYHVSCSGGKSTDIFLSLGDELEYKREGYVAKCKGLFVELRALVLELSDHHHHRHHHHM